MQHYRFPVFHFFGSTLRVSLAISLLFADPLWASGLTTHRLLISPPSVNFSAQALTLPEAEGFHAEPTSFLYATEGKAVQSYWRNRHPVLMGTSLWGLRIVGALMGGVFLTTEYSGSAPSKNGEIKNPQRHESEILNLLNETILLRDIFSDVLSEETIQWWEFVRDSHRGHFSSFEDLAKFLLKQKFVRNEEEGHQKVRGLKSALWTALARQEEPVQARATVSPTRAPGTPQLHSLSATSASNGPSQPEVDIRPGEKIRTKSDELFEVHKITFLSFAGRRIPRVVLRNPFARGLMPRDRFVTLLELKHRGYSVLSDEEWAQAVAGGALIPAPNSEKTAEAQSKNPENLLSEEEPELPGRDPDVARFRSVEDYAQLLRHKITPRDAEKLNTIKNNSEKHESKNDLQGDPAQLAGDLRAFIKRATPLLTNGYGVQHILERLLGTDIVLRDLTAAYFNQEFEKLPLAKLKALARKAREHEKSLQREFACRRTYSALLAFMGLRDRKAWKAMGTEERQPYIRQYLEPLSRQTCVAFKRIYRFMGHGEDITEEEAGKIFVGIKDLTQQAIEAPKGERSTLLLFRVPSSKLFISPKNAEEAAELYREKRRYRHATLDQLRELNRLLEGYKRKHPGELPNVLKFHRGAIVSRSLDYSLRQSGWLSEEALYYIDFAHDGVQLQSEVVTNSFTLVVEKDGVRAAISDLPKTQVSKILAAYSASVLQSGWKSWASYKSHLTKYWGSNQILVQFGPFAYWEETIPSRARGEPTVVRLDEKVLSGPDEEFPLALVVNKVAENLNEKNAVGRHWRYEKKYRIWEEREKRTMERWVHLTFGQMTLDAFEKACRLLGKDAVLFWRLLLKELPSLSANSSGAIRALPEKAVRKVVRNFWNLLVAKKQAIHLLKDSQDQGNILMLFRPLLEEDQPSSANSLLRAA